MTMRDASRRGFFALAGSAAAAASALFALRAQRRQAPAPVAAAAARPPEAPSDGGYRRTAHVEAYYRSTRVF